MCLTARRIEFDIFWTLFSCDVYEQADGVDVMVGTHGLMRLGVSSRFIFSACRVSNSWLLVVWEFFRRLDMMETPTSDTVNAQFYDIPTATWRTSSYRFLTFV
jgi:hypothetical protein